MTDRGRKGSPGQRQRNSGMCVGIPSVRFHWPRRPRPTCIKASQLEAVQGLWALRVAPAAEGPHSHRARAGVRGFLLVCFSVVFFVLCTVVVLSRLFCFLVHFAFCGFLFDFFFHGG